MIEEKSATVVVLTGEPLQRDEASENCEFKLAYIVYDQAHDKVFNLRRALIQSNLLGFRFRRIRNLTTQKQSLLQILHSSCITSRQQTQGNTVLFIFRTLSCRLWRAWREIYDPVGFRKGQTVCRTINQRKVKTRVAHWSSFCTG